MLGILLILGTLIIVFIIFFCLWYYVLRNQVNMVHVAKESNYVPYKYDRIQCQELLVKSATTKYKPKIAVVCVSIGNRYFSQITKNILEKYCKIHKYSLHYFTEQINSDYHIMWQKIIAFNQVMQSDKYDYVMWIDDDIIIKNLDIKIENFISLTDKPIITSRDIENDKQYNNYINAGTFIFKNCKIAKELLKEWIEGYNLFNGKFQNNHCYDQSIFVYLYFFKYHTYIEVLPHGIMQTIYCYPSIKEEFALHLAGLSTSKRNAIIQEFI